MECQKCGKREATLTFSKEPFLAVSHGWGKQEICRHCFIDLIEEHLKDCEKQLKEQKELLEKEKPRKRKPTKRDWKW